jgi:hypothetical protein
MREVVNSAGFMQLSVHAGMVMKDRLESRI